MKTLMIIILLSLSANIFAADKIKHKQMNDFLNDSFLATKSTTPNKALVYFSNDLNPDAIGSAIVAIDSADVSDGQLIITRPTTSTNLQIPPATITGTTLTSCQADFGEVTITPTQLIVYTDRLPVGIKCIGSGNMRMFFTTIQQ